jgi:hypothetical protein
MDLTILRIVTHWLMFSLIAAILIVLWLARGRQIRLSHLPLAFGSLLMFAFWVLFLALSVRDAALLPRTLLIPLLISFEAAGTFLGWAWFLASVRVSFTIVRKAEEVGANL